MYPQGHSVISDSMLEQMLQLPSAPMPHLLTSMDGSSSRSWKPNIEVAPNCPRCSSTNTKFCYYNNYSLSQPRYFCKGCRRYWTKGGSLRKVPIGGGCRKNRRGKSSRHQPQSEHHSLNNVNSSACDDREYSSSLVGGETNNGCSDIDMALVFAKFLNQNPNPGEEFESEANNGSSCSNNASTTSLTPESVEAENDAVMQPQKKPSDLPNFDADDAMLIGEVPRIENSVREELSFSGIDELDGFLGEDVVQDVLWSYDDAIMSSSVNNSWQPPMMQMQLQELEHSMMPFNEDSQLLPISSTINLLSDSWSTWSSFDVPTMEVFSSTL